MKNSNEQAPPCAPVSATFWDSPTLAELARAQKVEPVTDIRALYGTWPGEPDDGFERTIDDQRHPGRKKAGGP